jgi:hypothetical protein
VSSEGTWVSSADPGNIGAEQAYRSAPDGYTLLSSPPPPLVINQNLYRNLAFDPLKFEPIIVMAMVPNALFAALKLITRLAEQPLPYATLCPQYETIVDRRVRAIPRRTVAPAAAALQHMQDAADHSPVIHPVLTAHVRRKQRRNPVSSFSQRNFHRIFSAF